MEEKKIEDGKESKIVSKVKMNESFKVKVKLLTRSTVEFRVMPQEPADQIRGRLLNHAETCYITNFNLYCNDKLVQDYETFERMDFVENGSTLEMRTVPYDIFKAKEHIHRLKTLIHEDLYNLYLEKYNSTDFNEVPRPKVSVDFPSLFWFFKDIDSVREDDMKGKDETNTVTVVMTKEMENKMFESDNMISYSSDYKNIEFKKKKATPSPSSPTKLHHRSPPKSHQYPKKKTITNIITETPKEYIIPSSLISNKKKQKQNTKNTKNKKKKKDSPSELWDYFCQLVDGNFFTFRKCVKYIRLSKWNPVKTRSRLLGDLLYLVIETLENEVLHISSVEYGFYVNASTNERFDRNRVNTITHPTLVSLLFHHSDKFKDAFSKILYFRMKLPILLNSPSSQCEILPPWLISYKHQRHHFENDDETSDMISPLTNPSRDWNEEFNLIFDMYDPPKSPTQRVFQDMIRETHMAKFHREFLNASSEIGKKIIDGEIHPLGFFSPKKSDHIFLHKHINFTYHDDNMTRFELFKKFREEYNNSDHQSDGKNNNKGSENFDSYVGSNNEIHAMKYLHLKQKYRSKHLRTFCSCLLDYRGYRLLCQSYPGGLFEGMTNPERIRKQFRYGYVASIIQEQQQQQQSSEIETQKKEEEEVEGEGEEEDEKKEKEKDDDDDEIKKLNKFLYTPEIHEKIKEDLHSTFRLKSHQVRLYTDNEKLEKVDLITSTDSKILQAKDGRNYIFDVTRLTPRDPLFPDIPTAVFRYELVESFMKHKQKTSSSSTTTNTDDVQDQEIWNLNMFDKKVIHDSSEEQQEIDKKNILELSEYLKNVVIRQFIKNTYNQKLLVCDGESLTHCMHESGINMRYLGYLYREIQSRGTQQPYFLMRLCFLESFCRVTKNIFREVLRSVKNSQLMETITDFLNFWIGCETEFRKSKKKSPSSSSSSTTTTTLSSPQKQKKDRHRHHENEKKEGEVAGVAAVEEQQQPQQPQQKKKKKNHANYGSSNSILEEILRNEEEEKKRMRKGKYDEKVMICESETGSNVNLTRESLYKEIKLRMVHDFGINFDPFIIKKEVLENSNTSNTSNDDDDDDPQQPKEEQQKEEQQEQQPKDEKTKNKKKKKIEKEKKIVVDVEVDPISYFLTDCSVKLTLLRRFCQLTGLQVLTKKKTLLFDPSGRNIRFTSANIYSLSPKIPKGVFVLQTEDVIDLIQTGKQLLKQGKREEALRVMQRAEISLNSRIGQFHHLFCDVYMITSDIYFQYRMYERSLELLTRCANLVKKIEGIDSHRLIRLYVKIGEVCSVLNRFEDGLGFMMKSLMIFRLCHGNLEHPLAITIIKKFATSVSICRKMKSSSNSSSSSGGSSASSTNGSGGSQGRNLSPGLFQALLDECTRLGKIGFIEHEYCDFLKSIAQLVSSQEEMYMRAYEYEKEREKILKRLNCKEKVIKECNDSIRQYIQKALEKKKREKQLIQQIQVQQKKIQKLTRAAITSPKKKKVGSPKQQTQQKKGKKKKKKKKRKK